MPSIQKIGRIARLLAIAGISLGALVLSACGGKEKKPQHVESEPPPAAKDAGQEDAVQEPAVDIQEEEAAAEDARRERPDSDLWNVICE